jgi:hypothetical protein
MLPIALSSQNRREITAHAGKCRHLLLCEVQGANIGEPRSIELPPGASLHDTTPGQAHPLDGVDVLVCASMGEGLRAKVAERGILACLTEERDPQPAPARYLARELPMALPRPG